MCVCVYMYIYITRLALKDVVSPSNKIHWEVGRVRTYQHPCIKVKQETVSVDSKLNPL